MIDPLDGTKEFINKTGEFCVNIALVENNIPTYGIIIDPCKSQVLYGGKYNNEVKVGTFDLNTKTIEEECRVNSNEKFSMQEATAIVSRRANKDKLQAHLISQLGLNKIQFLTKGSALKFIDLALGNADLYPRFGNTMEWDIASGFAILDVLKGSILEMKSGKTVQFNKSDLLNPPFIAYNSIIDE